MPETDGVLNPAELQFSERKAQFGVIYLRAVAAVAGYSFAEPMPDHDSVDAVIGSKIGKRPRLDFQVKCTALDLEPEASDFPFDLAVKNYNELRIETITPRLLLVVLVPRASGDLLRQDERRLKMHRCGYWFSLRDRSPTSNTSSVTVQIPRANVLTPEALQSLMGQGDAE